MKHILLLFTILTCHLLSYAVEKSHLHTTDSLYIARCIDKAQLFFSEENRDSALYYMNAALSYSENVDDHAVRYNSYVKIGFLFSQSGNYSTALTYFFKAVDLLDENKMNFPEIERKKKYISLYSELAKCFRMSDPQKGIFYFRKGLVILDELQNKCDEAYLLNSTIDINNSIGVQYLELNNMDSAEIYFKKSWEKNKKLNDKTVDQILYNNLAITSFEKGEKDKSLDYFMKSAELCRVLKDTAQLANVYLNLGEYYSRQENWQQALDYCEQSLRLSEMKKEPVVEYKTMLLKTSIYENLGDYEKAYACLKLSDALGDSLKGSEKVRDAISLEMKYNYDKYKKNQELVLQEQRQQTFIYLLIAVVIIIGLLLLYFVLRNNYNVAQKKLMEQDLLRLKAENLELDNERLKKDLEFKEKEVNLHAQYLLKKKEVISDTFQQVENSEKEGKVIEEILSEVKKNIEVTTMNELEILLQSIHESFYENLYKKHPALTANERRLCTFIRLNLSSKDISAILGLQVKSVEMARSRLRSKLGLKREDNLSAYLQEF